MLNSSDRRRRRYGPALIRDVLLLCTAGQPTAFACKVLGLKPTQVKYIMRTYKSLKPDRIEQLERYIPTGCKWCYGDPLTNDFYFCNKPVESTYDPVLKRMKLRSYCSDHMALIFTPLTRRGKRKVAK